MDLATDPLGLPMIRCNVCPQPYTTTGRCEFFLGFLTTFNLWTSQQILLASYGHKLHCLPGLALSPGDAVFFIFFSGLLPYVQSLDFATHPLGLPMIRCTVSPVLHYYRAIIFWVFDLRSLTIPSIFGPRDRSSGLPMVTSCTVSPVLHYHRAMQKIFFHHCSQLVLSLLKKNFIDS